MVGLLAWQITIRLTAEKGNVREVPVQPGEKIEIIAGPKDKPPVEAKKPEPKAPGGDVDRRVALALLPHVETLGVQLADGTRPTLRRTDKVPAGSFAVVEFDLRKPEVWQAQFDDILKLGALEKIEDNNSLSVSPAELARLAASPLARTLKSLPRISELSAATVELLKRFGNLEVVEFTGAALCTDALLAEVIGAAPRLREFHCESLGGFAGGKNRLTERGWEALAALPLTRLSLTRTALPAEALTRFGSMKSLEVLNLEKSAFPAEALAALTVLPNLHYLYLNDTAVADPVLAILAKAPALQGLDVRGTKMTEAALRTLARGRPGLEIDLPAGARVRAAELLLFVGPGGLVLDGAGPPRLTYPFTAAQAKQAQAAWAERLKVKVETENSIGMKLVLIPPAGELWQRPYLIGKYEVTQGEWQAVMGHNPSTFKSGHKAVEGLETSRFPVENVSWYDGVTYCNKLSEREGLAPYYEVAVQRLGWNGTAIDEAEVKILGGAGYHLPTDAEWEHACRAGTRNKYHFGDSDQELAEYAWFTDNSGGRTHEVGEKKPNAFGLYDMHGNAREWNEEVYPSRKTGAPERVNRGGHWINTAGHCAVSYRPRLGPAYRYNAYGLRLARVPSGEAPVSKQE